MRKALLGCLLLNLILQIDGFYRDTLALSGPMLAAHATFRILEFALAAYIVMRFLDGRKDEEL